MNENRLDGEKRRLERELKRKERHWQKASGDWKRRYAELMIEEELGRCYVSEGGHRNSEAVEAAIAAMRSQADFEVDGNGQVVVRMGGAQGEDEDGLQRLTDFMGGFLEKRPFFRAAGGARGSGAPPGLGGNGTPPGLEEELRQMGMRKTSREERLAMGRRLRWS